MTYESTLFALNRFAVSPRAVVYFKADRDDRVTIASVFALAKEHGWKPPRGKKPPATEDDLALALVERHGHELRYVAAWSRWFEWRRGCWGPEKTLIAFDLTRKIYRGAPNSKEPSNDSV